MMNSSLVYNEDCYETLQRIESGTVNLLLQDTPFGVTQNDWDIKPDLQKMWPEWERVAAPNAAFIFFATQPFASELVLSNPKLFRYDLIWNKLGKATGFLNAQRMPLRSHEIMLVFYRSLPTYNPQKYKGHPNHSRGGRHARGEAQTNNNYGKFKNVPAAEPTSDKHPLSIWDFQSVHPPIHPTEKPVPLIRNLIRTYSNPEDLVYDGYLGSGTTRIACHIERRNFIGSELDKDYYEAQEKRFELAKQQLTIF